MRKLLLIAVLLGASFAAVSAFATADIVDIAKLFFGKWTATDEQQHPRMLDYYSDDARIIVLRTYQNGARQQVEMDGAKYKTIAKSLAAASDGHDDVYRYQNTAFSKVDDNTVKITAARYSLKRCYWDKSYYMVVQRLKGGQFGIIEEYAEDYAESQCSKKKQQKGVF